MDLRSEPTPRLTGSSRRLRHPLARYGGKLSMSRTINAQLRLLRWGWFLVLGVVLGSGTPPSLAQDIVYKPIDVNRLLVRPTQASASLAEKTIQMLGLTAAQTIENNGYVKTINNLFGKKIVVPHTQAGPSPLPAPTLFPSTRYPNYNQPPLPTYQRIRR